MHRLPVIGDGVAAAPFHIDQSGVALGAIADKAAGSQTRKIDADRDALTHVGIVGVDEPLTCVQSAQSIRVEQSMAAAEANLRQPRAFTDQHRKRARADLGIERTVIAGLDTVEAARFVGNHAREHIEPPGRAFRIGGGRNIVGQCEAFQQRHDVDAAGFQHRAVGQRNLV